MLDRFVADVRLGARDLLRHRRRTLAAAAAVAFGTAALILATGFIDNIFAEMREATIHSQLGHIKIARPGFFEAGPADPRAHLLPPGANAVATAIAGDPRVRAVAPRLTFNGLLSRGETTVSFVGDGVLPDRETELSRSIAIVDGQGLGAPGTAEVVIGEGLAAAAGVHTGDIVVLLANTQGGGVNAVEARVAGIFASAIKAYDDWSVRLPLPLAERLLKVGGAQTWTVLLARTEDTRAVLDTLRGRLPAAEFELRPWTALADFYNKTVALFSRQVAFVQVVIAIIIVLCIGNSMTMTVVERTGEIGTALALGVPRARVRRQFMLQGLMLGLVGGAAGVVLGLAAAQVLSAIGIPMPAPPGSARGYVGRIAATPALAAHALALAAITAALASILPAVKASRMPVVDALRHNR